MKTDSWYVSVPVTSLGVGIGIQYVQRVISYKKHLCHFVLEATRAHTYTKLRHAEKAAVAFSGTVVPLQ